MELITLVASALKSAGSLAASSASSASSVLASFNTAKGFFSVAGQFALSREISKELGSLSFIFPWGSFNRPFEKVFNASYENIAAKDLTARLRDIDIPKVAKPDMQNASKFVSFPK